MSQQVHSLKAKAFVPFQPSFIDQQPHSKGMLHHKGSIISQLNHYNGSDIETS